MCCDTYKDCFIFQTSKGFVDPLLKLALKVIILEKGWLDYTIIFQRVTSGNEIHVSA